MAVSCAGVSRLPVMISTFGSGPMRTWATYPSWLSLATSTRVGPQPDWSGSSSIHAHAIPRP